MRTLLLLILLMFSATARAQFQEEAWVSLAHYHFGEGYYEQKDYANALKSFQAAYSVMPMPEYAYDLAVTHWKMDNIYAAREWLRVYAHNRLTKEERVRVYRLGDILAPLISEDFDAIGLNFACARMGTKNQSCGIAQWSLNDLATYQIWLRKQ